MAIRKFGLMCTALAGVTMLSACGQGGEAEPTAEATSEAASTMLENGMTVQQQIELRQERLEDIGDAFKTISDQLKADSPDVAAIQTAAASVPELAEGMEGWFPEGTGPDTGLETDALQIIWEENADFQQKVTDMQQAAVTLNEAAQSGDIEAIGAAFKETGGTCKACHDKYRLDD